MNPKISKLRAEYEKNKSKIISLQARNRDLEKQIRELEDIDIIGMVRENGMTMEQFAKLFQQMQFAAMTTEPEKEEENHAENYISHSGHADGPGALRIVPVRHGFCQRR